MFDGSKAELVAAIRANDGYCPCQFEKTEDTKCPCKTYREEGVCECGLYEPKIKFEKVSCAQFNKDIGGILANPDDVWGDVILPRRSTANSAAYDFYAPYTFTLMPMQCLTIATGIKARMPSNNVLVIVPRSGLGIKYGMRLRNTVGIIDSDYYDNDKNEGHILLTLCVDSPITINAGERIVQGLFIEFKTTMDDNPVAGERCGGYGSTGA